MSIPQLNWRKHVEDGQWPLKQNAENIPDKYTVKHLSHIYCSCVYYFLLFKSNKFGTF